MARYRSEGFLDEIGETVIDHRRVLAVSAMYRRRVPGMFMGTSKTGSIVYIEPESTSRLSGELADALAEEKKEIYRILTALCTTIRPYTLFLAKSQKLLTEIDLLQAKARYAEEIGACLPKISRTLKMNLIEAYHPILLLTNRQQGRETFPQNIVLTPSRRIIAISGPNAGGKSITLKTVGLLQLMLQCGLPVPVNPESTMCLFNTIITDIGDNQSIENHLSTYSYRLKKMADFLSVCDEKTLFLIDEFGTGSDPDLGGALAEVFLEEFYRRGAYGVLTTHYTNIKLLAEKLPEAVNASMLFDEKTLMPLYRLFVGQAGSSFTFAVARMNGISQSLIDRARSRVEHDKIVLERTIASLQKEKSSIVEKSRSLSSAQKKAESHATALEKQSEKISSKLESYQVLYDRNVKEVQIGRKVSSLAESYFYKKTSKKDLTAALIKIVEMENARRGEKLAAAIKEKERQKAIEDEKQRERLIARERKRMAEEARREEQERERIEAQMQKEIEPIRAQKAIEEAEEAAAASRPALNMPLGVGDRVRLSGGYAVGVIDRIEKGRATVDYGWFTTQVAVEELDLVESWGVRLVQGFHFSPPLPSDEVLAAIQ
jgi:DNA mismatch repair protein MutS2